MSASIVRQLIEKKDNVKPKEIVVCGIYLFNEHFMNVITILLWLCNKSTNAH
jgi:hypothetical protein